MHSSRTACLAAYLAPIYRERKVDLPFHGWHHVDFVARKCVTFAAELNADVELTQAAALTHDLNYLVLPNSGPEVGGELRREALVAAGFGEAEAIRIDAIVIEADIATRGDRLTVEAQALSDADTLFKALPITPVLFSSLYLRENANSIDALAEKIVDEQFPLLDSGIYFYTDSANASYKHWAQSNLQLWQNVRESLQDPDVHRMLQIAAEFGAIAPWHQ